MGEPKVAKTYNEYRGCVHKIKYRSKRQAELSITASEEKYGVPMTYYKCKFCGHWHLTHRKKRRLIPNEEA